MMPLAGFGLIHEAERVRGNPGNSVSTKFLGIDGTVNTTQVTTQSHSRHKSSRICTSKQTESGLNV